MIDLAEIEEIARKIGDIVCADRIILFGSHATGQATADSDVDLLVVAESELPPHKRAREIYRRIRPMRFPVDIIVVTPDEARMAGDVPFSFISRALREGKTIYARRNRDGEAMG